MHACRSTLEDPTAARSYLDNLDASGSTNIEAALREAMRFEPSGERLPLVLFVTDGAPTVGERDPLRLAEITHDGSRGQRPRVFSFGVGADVNVTLLEQLALEGRGTSQFVRPAESVERSVALVASRLVDPVLTDVRVRTTGNVSFDRMLPADGADVFAGQDLVVFARYRGDGQGTVIVEGRQNGRAVRWTTPVNFPDRSNDNPFVARLWAAQRIGFLSAERRRNGGSSELDNEIRTLGERFSIPTEFTSYFVKEPVMNQQVRGNVGGGMGRMSSGSGAMAPTAAPAPQAQFEAARAAADQRAMKSVSALDSAAPRADANERSVAGHTFHLENDVWTDNRPVGNTRQVTVKAYSKAYFDLLKQIPELAKLAGVGEQVTVVGRGVVINIRIANGVETLGSADLSRIANDW